MRPRWFAAIGGAGAALAAGGATLAIALSGSETTSVVTACATATTPAHTVGVDGADVHTIPGASESHCETVTYTVPTVTETVATSEPASTTSPTTTASPPPVVGAFGIASGYGPINASDTDLARELDGYVALGASTLRIDFPWDRTEATQGVYNWSTIDRIVNAAKARNLDVIGTILWTPAWARSGGTTAKPPTLPATYASFAEQVVRRYAPQGIKTFELWNEPNIQTFWTGPNATTYTALVNAAYAKMHAADDTVRVLAGAVAPVGGYNDANCDGVTDTGTRSDGGINPVNFLQRSLAAGIQFDAWSVHPYEGGGFINHPCSAWKQMSETSTNAVGLLAGKPLWVTEYGNRVPSVTEAEQASRVTQAINLWKGYTFPRGRFMYFNYKDTGDGYGLARADWTHRPAWDAFKTAAG